MKREAINTFGDGLIMDLNPMTTPNNVLTNCLNGTVITYNGNEFVLQNDMGNGRVETAYLPDGFMPLGVTEYGGIVYIVSYNPLTNKSQIGSFPSPERNISSEETSKTPIILNNLDFEWNDISAQTFYVQKDLQDIILNPGDKFIVYADKSNITSNISKIYDGYKGDTKNKVVKLSFATITDDGKIVKLSNIKDYTYPNGTYIIPELDKLGSGTPNLDSYRSLTSSPYNIFSSKISGKLLLVAELMTIDSFDVIIDCEFIGAEGAATKDVNINADMSYTSKDDLYAYGITGTVTDKVISTKSILWKDDTKEQTALLHTVPNYDYKGRPIKNIEWSLTPSMSFGPVKYLTKSGILQLDKIGTGFTDLSEWRYYADNSSIQINWSLQSYPEPNHSITGVRFIMSCYTEQGSLQTLTYKVSNKRSYNGAFTEIVPFDVPFYKIEDNEVLYKNRLYYVTIEIAYSRLGSEDASKYKYFHRFLYTSDQFNKEYIDGKLIDFSIIKPTLVLGTETTYTYDYKDQSSKSVYGKLVTDVGDNQASIPDIESMSAKQIVTQLDLSGEITPNIKNSYDIFDLDPTSVAVTVNINNEDSSIAFGDYSIAYTGADSAEMDRNLSLDVIDDWDGEVPELPNDSTASLVTDKKYGFGSFISNGFTNKSMKVVAGKQSIPFSDIHLKLLEHTKAFAKLENKSITFSGTVAPIAYDRDSFARYNLLSNGSYFTTNTVCGYCQYERGGKNGWDIFSNMTSGNFTHKTDGASANGLASDVLWDNNQSSMRNAWANQSGPIAVAVWSQNDRDKSSIIGDPTTGYYGGWAWNRMGWSYGSQSGNNNFVEAEMPYHVFFKRLDDKFGLINMMGRVGENHPDGWNQITVMPFRGTDGYTPTHGFQNIFTCIAAMLIQLYRYDGIAKTENKIIPSSIYYIPRYTTDYTVNIKTVVSDPGRAKIRLKTLTNTYINIDSTMKNTLYDRNKGVTNNANDVVKSIIIDGVNVSNNNIMFELSSVESVNRTNYTTINTGIELRDMMMSSSGTNYGIFVKRSNGTSGNSIRTLDTSTVYYLNDKGDPMEIDSNFKLRKISKWTLPSTGDYTATLDDTVISGATNFTRAFKIKDGELRINEQYVRPTIRCKRTQGGKGDDGSVGAWSPFAPIDFLKCFN